MIIFILAFTLGVGYFTIKEPSPVKKTTQELVQEGRTGSVK